MTAGTPYKKGVAVLAATEVKLDIYRIKTDSSDYVSSHVAYVLQLSTPSYQNDKHLTSIILVLQQ